MKRSKNKKAKPNTFPSYWDLMGGSVALIKEVKEETNLDVKIVKIFHEESEPSQHGNTITFTRLVYECGLKNHISIAIIKLDAEEHTEYQLISSLDELGKEKILLLFEWIFK